jgi:hypothetical protein
MQHPDKHTCNVSLKNIWNIGNKHLQHMCTAIATYATSWSTFATSVWNTYNKPLKHVKHLKHMLAICSQHNISLPLGRMEARQRVEFTRGSDLAAVALRCSRDAAGAWLGEGSQALRLAGSIAERCNFELGRAPRLAGPAAECYTSEVAGYATRWVPCAWSLQWPLLLEWIGASGQMYRSDRTRGFFLWNSWADRRG